MDPAAHRCTRNCRRHGCAWARPGKPASAVPMARTVSESMPLYYMDQNQSGSTPYEVTEVQAIAMHSAGRGRYINHRKAFQLGELAPLRQTFFCSVSTDSSTSISMQEMQANVGITPNQGSPNEPPVRHSVIRAQQKVRAIGRHLEGSFDPKAPLAFGAPSWPVSRT